MTGAVKTGGVIVSSILEPDAFSALGPTAKLVEITRVLSALSKVADKAPAELAKAVSKLNELIAGKAPTAAELEPFKKAAETKLADDIRIANHTLASKKTPDAPPKIEPPIPRVNVANDFIVKASENGTNLRYGDPDGVAGLIVNVDKTGMLGFEIRAAQNHPLFEASGTDMFASAMQRLNSEGVQVSKIRGAWEAGAGSTNTAQYMQNISEGMSREAAALNTWTGRIAQKYGYDKVERIETVGHITYVTFGK